MAIYKIEKQPHVLKQIHSIVSEEFQQSEDGSFQYPKKTTSDLSGLSVGELDQVFKEKISLEGVNTSSKKDGRPVLEKILSNRRLTHDLNESELAQISKAIRDDSVSEEELEDAFGYLLQD